MLWKRSMRYVQIHTIIWMNCIVTSYSSYTVDISISMHTWVHILWIKSFTNPFTSSRGHRWAHGTFCFSCKRWVTPRIAAIPSFRSSDTHIAAATKRYGSHWWLMTGSCEASNKVGISTQLDFGWPKRSEKGYCIWWWSMMINDAQWWLLMVKCIYIYIHGQWWLNMANNRRWPTSQSSE